MNGAAETLHIDGAYGEGGGQILRTAASLSAITGRPIRIEHVRANRRRPGLARQHATALQCLKAITNARTSLLKVRAETVEFAPGAVRGGDYQFDIGTAGCISLVLQTIIPLAVVTPTPITVTITGGTDVQYAPPIDYLRFVVLPVLETIGIEATCTVRKRGYYPKGGGEVTLVLQPARALTPLALDRPGRVRALKAHVHCSQLPAHIADRMGRTARKQLTRLAARIADRSSTIPVKVAYDAPGAQGAPLSKSRSPGTGLVCWAQTATGIIGGDALGQRGVPAERVAKDAVDALRVELDAAAAVDVHAADMLLLYLALVGGELRTRTVTKHTSTNCWLIEQFAGQPFRQQVRDDGTHSFSAAQPLIHRIEP